MRRIIVLSLLLCLCGPSLAWGQIPQTISYQGRLVQNGQPVSDGNYSLTFRLWSLAAGGTALWTETQTVTTSKGLFTVSLGSVTPLSLSFESRYWIGIAIAGGAELSPRTPLACTGYSFMAKTVMDSAITTAKLRNNAITIDKLADNSVTAAKVQPNIVSSVDGVSNDAGNIDLVAGSNITITPSDAANTITIAATGAGTGDITGVASGTGLSGGGTSGDVTLSVALPLNLAGASDSAIIKGQNSGSGIGVVGKSTSHIGVYGISEHSAGVLGTSTDMAGVQGTSTSNYGLLGDAPYGDGGVYGHSISGTGVFGSSTNNLGVAGFSSDSAGVRGESSGGPGVYGKHTSALKNVPAVWGENTGSGPGVMGVAIADHDSSVGVIGGHVYGYRPGILGWAGAFPDETPDLGIGVMAYSVQGPAMLAHSTTQYGLIARTGTTTFPAVWAFNITHQRKSELASPRAGTYGYASDTLGVEGHSDSDVGVYGSTFGGPAGVSGLCNTTDGIGVYGSAPNGTSAKGVSGYSPLGRGVVGTSGSNDGVWGGSTSGTGVYGYSAAGDGVAGEALGANKSGVFGVNTNPAGYAGYFSGRVHVNGTFSKAAGSFRIDHPLDPANKYLQHSFVESPDMKNVYDGVVTTDASGLAVVPLPAWFEALNRDFRYQLTVIGQFAQAIISEKIAGNRFTILTDKPNVEVSWQVTGIRKDAYAEAHPIHVEVDKVAAEQGMYLHPAEHHVSESLGIDYQRIHEPRPRALGAIEGN